MRSVFNDELIKAARKDDRIFLVLADIGYGEVEPFAESFPGRYFNCGVAEQNMTGVACGIAMEGNIAVTYSIANFPTLRCLEQIRNDVCYHNANVKIVIIGGGMAYGPLGISHHSTEDIAIMRALPNMIVLAPCDFAEAREGVKAMLAHEGPVYYRCGYKQEPPVHAQDIDFKFGKSITVKDGCDASIIFTGTIGYNALLACRELEQERINCRLISMHTLKPIDREAVVKAAKDTGIIITVEEHNIMGGLGGAVAEVLMDEGCLNVKCRRIALPDVNISRVGSQGWLQKYYKMGPEDIKSAVRGLIG